MMSEFNIAMGEGTVKFLKKKKKKKESDATITWELDVWWLKNALIVVIQIWKKKWIELHQHAHSYGGGGVQNVTLF